MSKVILFYFLFHLMVANSAMFAEQGFKISYLFPIPVLVKERRQSLRPGPATSRPRRRGRR